MPLWLTYTIWTFLLTVPFYLLISRSGGAAGEKFPRRYRMMLWVPGLVALGYRILTRSGFGDVGYSLSSWWLLLAAVLLPFVIETVLIAIALASGWGQISPDILSFQENKLRVGENFGLLMREKLQSPSRFILNLLLSVIVGTLYTAIFAVGAEFGWRAYLQPLLIESYGFALGLVIVGLVWGYWLLPLVLDGYRFPYNPQLGAWVLMPATTVAYSLIAGWLYLAADNIWAPALFHGSLIVTGDLSEVGLGKAGAGLRIRLVSIALWYIAALFIGLLPR